MGFAHYNFISNVFEFIFTFVPCRINTRRKIKTERAFQEKRDNNLAISVTNYRTYLLLASMLTSYKLLLILSEDPKICYPSISVLRVFFLPWMQWRREQPSKILTTSRDMIFELKQQTPLKKFADLHGVWALYFVRRARCRASRSPNAQAPVVQAKFLIVGHL